MLKIPEWQYQALAVVIEKELEDDLFRFARAKLGRSVAGLSDEALRARIREDHEAARRFGVKSPRAVTRFIGLSLLCEHERFYEHPAALAFFTGPGVDPERQVASLLDALLGPRPLEE